MSDCDSNPAISGISAAEAFLSSVDCLSTPFSLLTHLTKYSEFLCTLLGKHKPLVVIQGHTVLPNLNYSFRKMLKF